MWPLSLGNCPVCVCVRVVLFLHLKIPQYKWPRPLNDSPPIQIRSEKERDVYELNRGVERTKTPPLQPAALAFVSYRLVLVPVRARVRVMA